MLSHQQSGRRSHGTQDVVTGNYFDKFHSTNRVVRHLMDCFVGCARELLSNLPLERVLEVGCGPGDFAARLLNSGNKWSEDTDYIGVDIGRKEILTAARNYPDGFFLNASAYALPFPDRAFDLVIACEVFEHLERPSEAMCEIARVCDSHLLLSVPWEPPWRVLNVLRGKYLSRLGNTPGHIQHYSRRQARRLAAPWFVNVAERRPLPWTMILASRQSTDPPSVDSCHHESVPETDLGPEP